jgi:hypothetical protein
VASLSTIRTGLQTRLATITGLNAYDRAPGTVTVPAAIVIPGTIEFDETMARGSDLYTFRVRLLVQRATETYAQEDLDAYLAGSGASSVKAAIEGDISLGGVADWTRVTGVPAYGDVTHAGIDYLGADFNVEVNVDGS